MSSNILLVDDSKTIRTHVRSILQHAEDDYQVVDKEDGYEALKWLSLQPQKALPDLVILDRNMPNMSGDDCIRVLKSDRFWKRIPVLFLTAQEEMTELVKGLAELEAEDYLPKPFDPREFLARVKVLIRIKKAEDLTHQLNSDLEHSLVLQKQAYDELKTTKIKLAETEAAAKLTGVFEKFVPKEFMNRIAPEGLENLIFGHAESDFVTILFSDIRAFTEISENLSPQELMDFLNGYLREMNPPIMEHQGFVDKFIGDAMMCIFGTPIPHDDDPDRAVRAAIRMMTDLKVFNDKRSAEGKMPIDHGMGINTDSIVSGNIGSPKRMDYTVIGDGVNLAARIESACKQYGAHILISEFTYKAVKATYRTRQVDYVIVKGKTEPVGVYEVLDFHDDSSYPNLVEALGIFNDGYRSWNEAKWDQAVKLFKDVKKLNPNDKAAQLYLDRCDHMKKNPPKGDWNGVWVMTTK